MTLGGDTKGAAAELYYDGKRVSSTFQPFDLMASVASAGAAVLILPGWTVRPSVTLSPDLTSIGVSVFENCTALESVTIPAGVTDIGFFAFSGCSSLSIIYFEGTRRQWDAVTKGGFWNNDCPEEQQVICLDAETVSLDFGEAHAALAAAFKGKEG